MATGNYNCGSKHFTIDHWSIRIKKKYSLMADWLTYYLLYRHANLPREQQQEEMRIITFCFIFGVLFVMSLILKGDITIEYSDDAL